MAACKDIAVDEILDACRRFHQGVARTPDVALAHKYPVKVIMAKMTKMAARGLIEYGVSLRTAQRGDSNAKQSQHRRNCDYT